MRLWKDVLAERFTRWERFLIWLRARAWKLRIDLCFDESDGYDVGAFVHTWKPSFGPFLFHRQEHEPGYPDGIGPWRLMIVFTKKAWDGFDDAAES